MTDLERINAELAEIQEALLALPGDAFAERYELQKRRDQLRKDAARYRTDFDEQRSTPELFEELLSIRRRLAAAEQRVSGFTMMSGPGGTGGSPGAVSGEMAKAVIDAKANVASDMGPLRVRQAAIERILAERGIDPATGRVAAPQRMAEGLRPDVAPG